VAKRTPPCPVYPKWTTAAYWSFVRSGLRAKFTRWPPKYEVIRAAKRELKVKVGNQKFEYQCAECLDWFKQKETEVDHIVACGSLKTFSDLAGFVERMFCSQEHLQVVCKVCHKAKTAADRKAAK
jgi:5-methylcytosine-specific restriction endonuclease McrA